MKILITGANGQLGQELMHLDSPHTLMGLTRAELDISNADHVQKMLKQIQPAMIINAAAYTQVDKAEQEKELAFAVNCEGVKHLAHYCASANIPLLHVSTDYVFAGDKTTPYQETDIVEPINVYGQSKLAGEQAITAILQNYIILRTSSIFSEYGNNFVKTILRLAREREQLRIVADTLACPTYAKDIASTLLQIVTFIQNNPQTDYTGIYHYCNNNPASWYQFAKTIVEQAKKLQPLRVQEVIGIPSVEYPTPAKRPPYSVLDTQKIQNTFHLSMNAWQTGLAAILPRLCA